ncbi:hypothetical protein ScalyP_jg4459 [Parmales sp. scaly parma]|nr:hypothetical protein ScalyP_jg4459 [Parmales sp. scaly parma]
MGKRTSTAKSPASKVPKITTKSTPGRKKKISSSTPITTTKKRALVDDDDFEVEVTTIPKRRAKGTTSISIIESMQSKSKTTTPKASKVSKVSTPPNSRSKSTKKKAIPPRPVPELPLDSSSEEENLKILNNHFLLGLILTFNITLLISSSLPNAIFNYFEGYEDVAEKIGAVQDEAHLQFCERMLAEVKVPAVVKMEEMVIAADVDDVDSDVDLAKQTSTFTAQKQLLEDANSALEKLEAKILQAEEVRGVQEWGEVDDLLREGWGVLVGGEGGEGGRGGLRVPCPLTKAKTKANLTNDVEVEAEVELQLECVERSKNVQKMEELRMLNRQDVEGYIAMYTNAWREQIEKLVNDIILMK